MSVVFYRIDDSPNALSFAAAHSRSDFFNLGSEYIMGCLEAMMTILSKQKHTGSLAINRERFF